MTFRDRLLLTSLARPRLYAVLFGSFAAAAVLVVAVGLFGVLSYTVAQRSRELGIRLALGAQRRDLVLMVVRQGIAVAVAGVIVGLTIAAVLGRFVGTLLYGVSPGDPLTYVVVPAVLLVLSAAASYIPARRAASVDPLRTLRAG
jgi:putative ABC transport system permease protein